MNAPTRTLTDAITAAIGPLSGWAHKCHAASLALVKSGALTEHLGTPGRVARGACHGVPGQHSWVVAGPDVYDRHALIVDVTLWSYTGTAPEVWVGNMAEERLHVPHGSANIWEWGRPIHGGGETIPLDTTGLSGYAAAFVHDMMGPLDALGWAALWSSGAMQGWPAAEVLEAFLTQHPDLTALVPIDVIGHLTDRNPSGLFLP